MKILHITPHLGGGIGTVVLAWMGKVDPKNHEIFSLDMINGRSIVKLMELGIESTGNLFLNSRIISIISNADIAIVHWWDHPMLAELIASQLPPCRLVFWCHKNYDIPDAVKKYPDLLVGTSPIQGLPQYVWSTGNMDRFFELQPTPHEGFNTGSVWSKKMSIRQWMKLYQRTIEVAPEISFTMLGDIVPVNMFDYSNIRWAGKVDDVAPYLQSMDVFGYPLRPDHYGTCEQVIGEAMAVGLPVVAMNNSCEQTIIQEGVTGYLCSSEEEYIDNIVHLYHKPNLRKWMGQNAREAAAEKYNVDNMIKQWDYIFELMMAEPKKERVPVR